MDFSESEEHALIRRSVRGIADRFGHHYFVDKARAGEKSNELWDALSEAGFTGINVKAPWGGAMGMVELAIVAEETAAAGCPLLLFLVSPAICGEIIGRFGTVDQQARWLPGIGSGTEKMAFAITEPDAGTNSHAVATTAKTTPEGFELSGTKYYISGIDESANVLVVTRTGTNDATGRAELSLFVVPTNADGVSFTPIDVQIVAPEKQFTVYFDNVALTEEHLIGPLGGGLRPLFAGLNPERIMSAAVANGIARYALEKAADYARTREVWGVPIGTHQGLSHPLAKAAIDVELARLMTTKAAWCFDNDIDAGEAANMAKLSAADAALFALDQAMQTHGGNGMATEYGLATMWGLARLLKVAPVSREMVLNYIATHTLSLPRSY